MKRLDAIDMIILSALQDNARITNVELAKAVHLSATPCFNRVKAMEQRQLIQRYVTLLNPDPFGLRVSVFIQVRLERQVEDALQNFEQAIQKRPEVMECYLMTGDSDYFLRVLVADISALERFILDHLTKIPGVANIRSSFALKQVKYKTALPLAPEGMVLLDKDEIAP